MKKIAYISGGIGGAKLAKRILCFRKTLTFQLSLTRGMMKNIHGVKLSPDIDSVMYALAGIEGEFGWGQKK